MEKERDVLIAVWLLGLYAVHWTTQPGGGGGGGSPMVHGERERCVDSHMADGVVFCALDNSARWGGGGSPMVHGERERCVDSCMAAGVVCCALDDSAWGGGGGAALWYMEKERDVLIAVWLLGLYAVHWTTQPGGGGGQPYGTWREREMC